jgi:8-oxo-dGTP pyrophosphatase MutT (NUDIX family)
LNDSPPSSGEVPTDKVTAFITRVHRGDLQIVVFDHPEIEGSGVGPSIQVPAGTVEPGETAEEAVLREAVEETGLAGLSLVRQLGTVPGLAPDCWMVTRVIVGTKMRRGHAVREMGAANAGGEIAVMWEGHVYSVPAGALTQHSTRYLFELRTTEPAPDEWPYNCDCGVPIILRWSSIRETRLHDVQQPWLNAVCDALTDQQPTTSN